MSSADAMNPSSASTSLEREITAAVMVVLQELVTVDLFISLINFSSLKKLLLISNLIHVCEWEEQLLQCNKA